MSQLVRTALAAIVLGHLTLGCTGDIAGMLPPSGDEPATEQASPSQPPADDPLVTATAPIDPFALVVPMGARRLTVAEYTNAVELLLGERPPQADLDQIPRAAPTPFDNDVASLKPDQPLITAMESLAEKAALRFLANAELRDRRMPCKPSGAGDTVCLRRFVESFGRLAFRRPLEETEKDHFTREAATIGGATGSSAYDGVELVIRSMLQDPAFLYRIETGTPVAGKPGVFALSGHEIATRMSFLLWQHPPEAYEPLRQAADAGSLRDAGKRRELAAAMLADGARGLGQKRQFHTQWLGVTVPGFTDGNAAVKQQKIEAAMAESTALIDRVVKEKRPWMDLFRMEETFVPKVLSDHYGLRWPGAVGETAPRWVSYGASGRKGLLAHATLLTNDFNSANERDTPVHRGKFLMARLLCRELQLPEPETLASIKMLSPAPEPAPSACKIEHSRYRVEHPGCGVCHKQMEPPAIGLENYDGTGKYRTSYVHRWTADQPVAGFTCPRDPNDDTAYNCTRSCPVATEGADYRGPAGLADKLLARSDARQPSPLEHCAATQLFRFAAGRREVASTDGDLLAALGHRIMGDRVSFDDLLLDWVSSDAFRHTRQAE